MCKIKSVFVLEEGVGGGSQGLFRTAELQNKEVGSQDYPAHCQIVHPEDPLKPTYRTSSSSEQFLGSIKAHFQNTNGDV